MKRFLFLCTLYFVTLSLFAVTYCTTAPFGYGAAATGGGNATPTKVTSLSDLKTALSKGNNVILITKSLTVDKTINITKSNITILGATGVTLTNKTIDQGVFHFSNGSNYIIRNIAFVGPSATSNQGGDLLCFEGAKKAWVDHCSFDDGADGNFDICKGADNITVTWCRFKYSTETTHNFSNLVGSSSSDAATDGTFNVTYAYCWWDEGCHQRMVRARNSAFHFLNCYWNSSVAEYYIGLENSTAYIEGCYFGGSLSGSKIMGQGNSWYKESTNGFTFVNCHSDKSLPSEDNSRTVIVPSYSYPEPLTYTETKKAVTNASCGAGATLTISSSAEIYSACDNGETPPEKTDTTVVAGDCCIDLSMGVEPTVANGGIPSEYGQVNIIVNLAKGTWDNGYLNMGGNADYITFDFSTYTNAILQTVSFDVTIPNWTTEKNTIAYHWNDDANTKYTISGAAKETVTLAAPANATSFTIQRSAGTSTRIAKVCFSVDALATIITSLPTTDERYTLKLLRDGQLLILRNNHCYTPTGQRIY